MGLEETVNSEPRYLTAVKGATAILFGGFAYKLGEMSIVGFERAYGMDWLDNAPSATANYFVSGCMAFSSIALGAAAVSTLGWMGYKAYKNREK